jgi:hypothetical protein
MHIIINGSYIIDVLSFLYGLYLGGLNARKKGLRREKPAYYFFKYPKYSRGSTVKSTTYRTVAPTLKFTVHTVGADT